MRTRLAVGATALALLLALAGCTSPSGSTGDAESPSSAPPAEDAPAAEAIMTTANSSLGEIVVDADGKTLYMFDNDEQGTTTSACTGQCLDNWPPFVATGDDLTVDGVTGDVATIETPDGEQQVTLNGWPLYYFAADGAAGDVNGQGVGGIWWVLTPEGERFAG